MQPARKQPKMRNRDIAEDFVRQWSGRSKLQRIEAYLAGLTPRQLATLTTPDLITALYYQGIDVSKGYADQILRRWRPRKHTGRKPTSVWTVYRYYDAADRLLYVGATGQGHWRARAHNRTALWWPLVARAEFEHFTSEDEAFTHEGKLIVTLNPLYNVADNPNRTAVQNGSEPGGEARIPSSPAGPAEPLPPRPRLRRQIEAYLAQFKRQR
jgi:hypothetical protein